jgi:hypothetical protein
MAVGPANRPLGTSTNPSALSYGTISMPAQSGARPSAPGRRGAPLRTLARLRAQARAGRRSAHRRPTRAPFLCAGAGGARPGTMERRTAGGRSSAASRSRHRDHGRERVRQVDGDVAPADERREVGGTRSVELVQQPSRCAVDAARDRADLFRHARGDAPTDPARAELREDRRDEAQDAHVLAAVCPRSQRVRAVMTRSARPSPIRHELRTQPGRGWVPGPLRTAAGRRPWRRPWPARPPWRS